MMKVSFLVISALLINACRDGKDHQSSDCRLALTLDFDSSQIDSTAVSTAVYKTDLPFACIRYLTSAQKFLEVVEIQNQNSSFRLQSFQLSNLNYAVSFLELTRAQVLSSQLYNGFLEVSRDNGKSEDRLQAEQRLLESLRLPFDLSSPAEFRIEAQVLGQPKDSIEVRLQESPN
ncbi:MAG: hypothetical protein EOP04_07380 [Proteobacteria bacterium]|nr:MAG: hypothetical protein EOP04_07380 [Pseudomonadota bacterium]